MSDKQNWLSRVFSGAVEVRSEPLPGVMPPVRDAYGSLSVDEALSISAVYRAVNIIVSAVSQMPLGVYRDGLEIKTPSIVSKPNINQSQREFIRQTVWSLVTTGNAYWRIYGTYPTYDGLEVLDPAAVAVTIESGKYRYWVHGKEVNANTIKHIRKESIPGQALGIGPIQRGADELRGAFALKQFQDNWFGRGIPTGILTTDSTLTATQQAQYAEAWNTYVANNGGTAVLGNGMRYEHLNLNPAQAQFLEISQSKTTGVARLFGVPATLLASGNEGISNTYMNNQELFMNFLQTTLIEYIDPIEDAISSLLPRGQEANFKEDRLLRMNSLLEAQVRKVQIETGTRTPDELRAEDGLPPLPSGYAVPGTANTENKDTTEDDES